LGAWTQRGLGAVAGHYHSFVIRPGSLGYAAKFVIEHRQTGTQVQVGSSAEAVAWIGARCRAPGDSAPAPAALASSNLSGACIVSASMEDVALRSRHPDLTPA
jgi:hypothetical protein